LITNFTEKFIIKFVGISSRNKKIDSRFHGNKKVTQFRGDLK